MAAPAFAAPAFAVLAFAAFSVAAVHVVAATAESAADAFVLFAACAPRPPFVERDAGDRGLAVAGVFAVPGPASVEAFPAAADISGPSSHFRYEEQRDGPWVQGLWDDWRGMRGGPHSRVLPEPLPGWVRHCYHEADWARDSQVDDTELQPLAPLRLHRRGRLPVEP